MAQRGGPVGAARPRIAGSHPPYLGRVFPTATPTESASQPGHSKRDALFGWRTWRKACPGIPSQSWTGFPVESFSGNRIPEYTLKLGCAFQTTGQRKTHPILRHDSGTQLPVEGQSGKRISLRGWIPGRSFRRGPKKESTSLSECQFWVVISAEGSKGKAHPILSAKSGTQLPYAEALQTKGPGSRWSWGQRRSLYS